MNHFDSSCPNNDFGAIAYFQMQRNAFWTTSAAPLSMTGSKINHPQVWQVCAIKTVGSLCRHMGILIDKWYKWWSYLVWMIQNLWICDPVSLGIDLGRSAPKPPSCTAAPLIPLPGYRCHAACCVGHWGWGLRTTFPHPMARMQKDAGKPRESRWSSSKKIGLFFFKTKMTRFNRIFKVC